MNNALPLQQYTLGEGVTTFSTTRQGGVSTGDAYASFNINPYCGDTAESVEANRALLCQTLGIDDSHLVMPHQTHGIDSRIISAEFCALPASVRAMILEGVDAVMTNEKGLCIGVSTADCVPVLLFDPVHQAVCAVHAGWRGTVARVTHKAVVDMKTAFGTLPADLKAVIGPAISMSAFEVGDEVYEQFAAATSTLTPLPSAARSGTSTCRSAIDNCCYRLGWPTKTFSSAAFAPTHRATASSRHAVWVSSRDASTTASC